jgi:hypothetical protein
MAELGFHARVLDRPPSVVAAQRRPSPRPEHELGVVLARVEVLERYSNGLLRRD